MPLMTVSICSSRLITGLDSPPAVRADAVDSLVLTSAWNASTVTMPATVTATFAALSSAPPGGQPEPEQRRDGQPRRDPDHRSPTARRASDVVQRGHGAAARRADGR